LTSFQFICKKKNPLKHAVGCRYSLKFAKEEETVTFTGGTMKKTILLITTTLLLFSFSTVHAQDQDISKALVILSGKLNRNFDILRNSRTDLWNIAGSHKLYERQVNAILTMNENITAVRMVHKYLIPTAMLSFYIRKDELINYYRITHYALSNSNTDLNELLERSKYYYPDLENKALLHTADKFRDILRDSLREIDPVLKLLSKAIGPTQ